jgi:ATP-dependent Clp protease ATP-binding subunit ClpA
MFERFTEEAKSVLVAAQDVAIELGSRNIDAIHLLYGCAVTREETAGRPLRDLGVTAASIRRLLPREEEHAAGGVDPDALHAIGIDYEEVRATVERNFGPGALDAAPDRRVGAGSRRPPFTPDAKRSLELALRVAIELHFQRIVPGHLLLGLLRLDNEDVVAAIEQSGTTVAALSAMVLTRLATAA